MKFTLNLILDLWLFYHMKSENRTQALRCFSRLASGAFPWASQWVIVLPPRCVQDPGVLSSRSSNTAPVYCCPQPLCTPPARCSCGCVHPPWLLFLQVFIISVTHVNLHLFVETQTVHHSKLTSMMDLLFPLPTTYSLCWVTHGCRLFKKPSAWIYIPTLRSLVSQHDWQRNGEGWVSGEAHRT